MNRRFSILSATLTGALALAPAFVRAEHGGRVEQMLREALAATRVAPPDGAPPPSAVALVAVPVGTLSPATPDLTAHLPPAPIPATPVLAMLSAPTGPFYAIPAPGGPAVRLPPPIMSTPPTPVLATLPAPTGPFYASPAPIGAALPLPPPALVTAHTFASPLAPSLPTNFAALAAARLVRDSLTDGSLNPRNPAWRPHLLLLLTDAASSPDTDALFATLLAGCGGYDDRARLATAEAWAGTFEGGRFAATMAYCAARRNFVSGDYAAAAFRCERLIVEHPEAAERAMLLLALARAQAGDRASALQLLREFREKHPESPAAPEARFMEAWLALQDSHNEEALAILRAIVTETPSAPAAAKAASMLASLEGIK